MSTSEKLNTLKEEETKLLQVKEKLIDQLRRLQVEELALRSMLQTENGIEIQSEEPDISTFDIIDTDMELK